MFFGWWYIVHNSHTWDWFFSRIDGKFNQCAMWVLHSQFVLYVATKETKILQEVISLLLEIHIKMDYIIKPLMTGNFFLLLIFHCILYILHIFGFFGIPGLSYEEKKVNQIRRNWEKNIFRHFGCKYIHIIMCNIWKIRLRFLPKIIFSWYMYTVMRMIMMLQCFPF